MVAPLPSATEFATEAFAALPIAIALAAEAAACGPIAVLFVPVALIPIAMELPPEATVW
nr:hypothetical protein [Paraburkholderia sp. J8-2]